MNEEPFNRSSTVSPVTADVLSKSTETETPADFSDALIIPSDAAATLTAFVGFPGAVVSPMTVKSDVGELGLPTESVSTAFSA